MRLVMRRSQNEQTGLFGGHRGMSFQLDAVAQVTAAEQALLQRYTGVESTRLTTVHNLLGKMPDVTVTVGSLLRGHAFVCKDVLVLLEAEENIKEACRNFRTLLDVMESFGGEIVVDFESASGSPRMDAMPPPSGPSVS